MAVPAGVRRRQALHQPSSGLCKHPTNGAGPGSQEVHTADRTASPVVVPYNGPGTQADPTA